MSVPVLPLTRQRWSPPLESPVTGDWSGVVGGPSGLGVQVVSLVPYQPVWQLCQRVVW